MSGHPERRKRGWVAEWRAGILTWLGLGLLCFCAGERSGRAQGINPELRDKLTDATVYIETQVGLGSRDWSDLPEIIRKRIGDRPSGMSSGSGFLITRDGYVLTNAHVVQGFLLLQYPDGRTEQLPPHTRPIPFDIQHPDQPFTLQYEVSWIRVVVDSGTPEQVSQLATLVRVEPDIDLAILKIPSDGDLSYLDIGWTEEVRAGNAVLMSGFPGGIYTELAPFVGGNTEGLEGTYSPRPSVNAGLVTAIREYKGSTRYQLDIRANSGNSGGPITNVKGEVVAILYAQLSGLQSINYAIPIRYVLPIMPSSLRSVVVDKDTALPSELEVPESQGFDEFLESGKFSF